MRPIHPNRRRGEKTRDAWLIRRHLQSRYRLDSVPWLRTMIKTVLKATHLYRMGVRNAQKVRVVRQTFSIPGLPANFQDFRILFISDLHIEGVPDLVHHILALLADLTYDICILGGDYRFRVRGNEDYSNKLLADLIPELLCKSSVYGILGNHDTWDTGVFLESLGVTMLTNEHLLLHRDADALAVVMLEDAHYFDAADFDLAEKDLESNVCKLLISHSPELFEQAAKRGYKLYLAGHTHGGQICLPGEIPLLTNAAVPGNMVAGKWQWQEMYGYTSRGAGSGIVPVRFFSQPEVVLITLK